MSFHAQSVVTSKWVVSVGVVASVFDAGLQWLCMNDGPVRFCLKDQSEKPDVWNTSRTFKVFTLASTIGAAGSLGSYVAKGGLQVLLNPDIWLQFLPCEVLLLPLQYTVFSGHSQHLVRHVPFHLLVYTAVDLSVYIPVQIVNRFLKSDLLYMISLNVQTMWIGLSALVILFFVNIYPQKMREAELPSGSSKALRWSNPALIIGSQFGGNLAFLFLTSFVILNRSHGFPFMPSLPLWCYQITINTQMQLADEEAIPTVTKTLRMVVPALALPAQLKVQEYLPSLDTLANVLAFAAYMLWIGTFNTEWEELYDKREGVPSNPDWWVDHIGEDCVSNLQDRIQTRTVAKSDVPEAVPEAVPEQKPQEETQVAAATPQQPTADPSAQPPEGSE